ncbi:putative PPE family protein PPE29 [Mycobacterium marinum]|uniref:PPE family protein n=1 Tax=Mycobacterium marinum (strain ATCC BAA-535 / M) TaxID=216594 RepID=B2HFQ7_MYCMM|nr:PPE family protein [Mycobacterium marinum]ACC39902.1 PPE family protein [Mycobacterium marinum M]RFZ06807.1 putative PPE family protein PPE29 [Mycobacterium marinum]RFZ46781.1 putative PPE family protein PPE29 [Mycobacterium marinum]GJO05442.1 PPE family protein [Mycobacterium marinum]
MDFGGLPDFGGIPPEVNSGLMYAGPGPGSMLTSATAWDGLAAAMSTAAASYGSVIAGLKLESWLGPAAASMATAAAPYAGWLSAAAAQAQQTATQARAAAAAFEEAFAATVPPPLIAANRNQLVSLAAANTLGQNSPAIEAAQAEYAEMWAQDAAAMYSYAGASEAASMLTPFNQPSQTVDPAGPLTQAAAAAATNAQTALAQLLALSTSADLPTSGLPGLTSSPTGPLPAAPIQIPTPIGELDAIGLYIAVIASGSIALSITNTFRPWNLTESSGHGGGLGPTHGGLLGSTTAESGADSDGGAGAAPMSAAVGHAALVGALSVPHNWTLAAPEIKLAVEALPSTSVSSGPPDLGGVPTGLLSGMAVASLAGRGIGATGTPSVRDAAPEEGEGQPKRRPTVVKVPKPPPADGLPPH